MLHEYLIEKQEIDLFGSLIPPMFRDEIERDMLFAVATFDDLIIPERLMGIVLVRVRYDWQEIAWVGMTDRYSSPEYAADLIKIRTACANERGVLFGTFSEFPLQETVRSEFYDYAGFSSEITTSRVYQISTGNIDDRSSHLSPEDEKRCFTLRYVTEKQKRQIEEDFVRSKIPLPLEIPIKWDDYDRDATVLYEREGVVEAALFVVKHPDSYALEGVFGAESKGSYAILEYYRKHGAILLGDRPLFLVPVVMLSVERVLSEKNNFHTDQIALVWRSYEKNRKKRGYLSFESYYESDEKDVLGLKTLGHYYGFSDRSDWDQSILIFDEKYFYKKVRDKEAVHARYRVKMEESSRRIGIPPIVLIQRNIATEALRIYKSGKARSLRISEYGFFATVSENQMEYKREDFNRPPVTIREQYMKAAMLAGILVRRTEAYEEMKIKPGDSIREKAVYAVKSDVIKIVSEGVEANLALAGVDYKTGEKLTVAEQLEVIRKTPEALQKMSKVTREFDRRVVEKMIEMIESEDDFKKELKRQLEFIAGIDEIVISAEWEKLRKHPKFAEISDTYDKAMSELNKLMSQLTNLSTKIALLARREEFEGYRDIVIDEIYASQIRTLSYYIDSTESYLQYLYDGTPIGAMQGVYIREKIEGAVPCPDPNAVLEEQLGALDARFEGIAPWETDCATVFMIWQRMQERKNKNVTARIEVPDGAISIEYCEKLAAELERKKHLHPELFREPMLTTIFNELPELYDLFNEAFEARNVVSRLIESEAGEMSVKKNLFIRVSAIYDTLLRRSRYIIAASRTTMKNLLKLRQDYQSCDYEYVLKECTQTAKMWDKTGNNV